MLMMITKWSNMVTRFLFLHARDIIQLMMMETNIPHSTSGNPVSGRETPGWGDSDWKMLSQKNQKMFATIKFWQDGFLLRLTTLGSVNPLQLDPYFLLLKKHRIYTKKLNVLKRLGFELFIKINSWRSWVLQ